MNNKNTRFLPSITPKHYALPFTLITLLFFLWGFARAILDLLNKHFQNQMGISIAQSAGIQVTTYLGYFLMAIPSGLFIKRFGYRRGVVYGLFLFALGCFLFIPSALSANFYSFLGALFVIGCGLTFLETAANPYVTQLGSAETATSRLNLSQSFNGLGSIFATFIVGQFLFPSTSPNAQTPPSAPNITIPYVLLGSVVLIVAFFFNKTNLPVIAPNSLPKTTQFKQALRQLLTNKLFMLGLTALLAYEIAEISINSYFINYVTAMKWLNDNQASVALTLALSFFMVGRFIGSYVLKRFRATLVLLVCALGTFVCCALVLTQIEFVSFVSLLGLYLFEAIMFPTIFALSIEKASKQASLASSLLMMTPIGGCAFLGMGHLAETFNPTFPFIVPLVCFGIIVVYAVICVKHKS